MKLAKGTPLENHIDKVSSILEQAKSIAKEFSAHIESLYLIGSAAVSPQQARDVDMVIFCSGDPSIKKIISIKFLQLTQINSFKVDSVCLDWPFGDSLPSIFDPHYRIYISIFDHGRLLTGHALKLAAPSQESIWSYRWWCLYADLLMSSDSHSSPIVQAEAQVVREEINYRLAFSKQGMLKHLRDQPQDPLDLNTIVQVLSSSFARFEALSDLKHVYPSLFSPLWLKPLHRYCQWLELELGHKNGHTLLRMGLEIQWLEKYFVIDIE